MAEKALQPICELAIRSMSAGSLLALVVCCIVLVVSINFLGGCHLHIDLRVTAYLCQKLIVIFIGLFLINVTESIGCVEIVFT
jgi:hypothetical protein